MEKIVKKAYKFRFYQQHDLAILLANTFGCVLFVYNHLLHISEENFKTKFLDNNPPNKGTNNINPQYKSLSNNDRINYVKKLKDNPDYAFLKEVSSIALQQSAWHNRNITEAYRYYPSSKMCNCCKHINNELKLSDRVWECPGCNAVHDRDENACINLYNYDKELNNKVVKVKSNKKISSTAGGPPVEACGGNIKPASVKKRVVSDEARILALKDEVSSIES